MILQALVAYAHFASIFSALGLLVAELMTYRKRMRARAIYLLPRLDLGYLLAVVAIIFTGLLRVFFFEKGAGYYVANPIFWVKMGLFLLVGLLSLPPTFEFLRNRRITEGKSIEIEDEQFRRMQRYMIYELAVFALIPLAATLMARGVGM